MNFRTDIKKFPKSHYVVDAPLNHLENSIKLYCYDWLGGEVLMNPDFQRGHVWTEEQQIAYIEYLLREPDKGPGTMIVLNAPMFREGKSDDPNVYCIDGLQRYTAIQKFLNNELKVFGYYMNEYEDCKVMLRAMTMQLAVFNFPTREEMLEYYLAFNSGGTVHSKEELEKVKGLLELETACTKEDCTNCAHALPDNLKCVKNKQGIEKLN